MARPSFSSLASDPSIEEAVALYDITYLRVMPNLETGVLVLDIQLHGNKSVTTALPAKPSPVDVVHAIRQVLGPPPRRASDYKAKPASDFHTRG